MTDIIKPVVDGLQELFLALFSRQTIGLQEIDTPYQKDIDRPALVTLLESGTVKTAPSPDQDPIYDHANGVKVPTGVSAVVFTPAAGCKFVRASCDVDVFLRTDDEAAADDGEALMLGGFQPPETIPVTPGVPVRAYSATAGTLRLLPMKVRP